MVDTVLPQTAAPIVSHSTPAVLYYVAVVALIGYGGFMMVHIISVVYGQYVLHVRKKNDYSNPIDPPGVSIIKPYVGYNEKNKGNLETFFQLKYPKFELLICLGEHENPPSLKIVEELREQYPNVDAKVFIGASQVGINPKVNNMYNGYSNAQYELIWIADSGLSVPPHTLLEMTRHFSHPKTALVQQIPYVPSGQTSFADCLEMVYFGTQHARVYFIGHLFNQNVTTGSSMMLRKACLDSKGGLEAFGCYLAEDYFIGKALRDQGLKSVICSIPGDQVVAGRSIIGFRARMIRWGKIRSAMVPVAALLEPLSECFSLGILMCLVSTLVCSINPLILFGLHTAYWLISDLLLMSTLNDGFVYPLWKVLLMWLLRESMAPPLMIASSLCSGKIVNWGGCLYELKSEGHAVSYSKPPSPRIV